MAIKKILGQNISFYRRKLNLTQEEFSDLLNITPCHLSNIEQGKQFISEKLLEKISEVLQVSPYILFYSFDTLKNNDNLYSDIDKIIREKFKSFSDELIDEIRRKDFKQR
ncbi:MAG: helix-turn-helix transcriptional regulator [Ignavibacteriales bacterium]|nr:helix-turn-helix transcriptional regulator [Ignavibacteriales bacterium]